MNHKLSYYIKKGSKESKQFMHQNVRFYFGYALYALISFIGKQLGLLYPVFALSDMKLSENIVDEQKYNFNNVLDDSNDIKKVWQIFIFSLIKFIMIAIGVGVSYLLFIYLAEIGGIMDEMFRYEYYYLKLVFQIISVSLGSLYVLFIVIKFSLGVFLIQQYETMGLSEAFTESFKIMDNHTSLKAVLIYLYHILVVVLFGLVLYGTGYLTYINLHYIMFVIVCIVLFLIYLLALPRFTLSLKISLYALYKDASKAYLLDEKIRGGVDLSEEHFTKEDLLEVLFNAKESIKNDEKPAENEASS